jgi:hypothetical protein
MNYRAAAQRIASGLSDDFSMDPSQSLGNDVPTDRNQVQQPDVDTDGVDPATPGGAAPYNAETPYGAPVVSDPEWLDPAQHPRSSGPVPFRPGPGVDTTTIHNARRNSYAQKTNRTERQSRP